MATCVERSFIHVKLHSMEVSIVVPLVGSALSHNSQLLSAPHSSSVFSAHTPLALHHPVAALFPFMELFFTFTVNTLFKEPLVGKSIGKHSLMHAGGGM